MSDAFRDFVSERVEITASEWERVAQGLVAQSWEAGDLLLRAGETCHSLYFLETGVLRFYAWTDEEEKTKFFTPPGQVFTSQSSFSRQLPAKEYIEALIPAQTVALSFDEVQLLYEQIPAWSRFIRLVLQEVNGWTEALLTDTHTQTAADRYRHLLEEESDWVRHVPLKYLASYLGIAPESLSRIRKKFWQEGRT